MCMHAFVKIWLNEMNNMSVKNLDNIAWKKVF